MNDKREKRSSVFGFRTVEQFSAGGAAYRENAGRIEFAIVAVNPSRRWQLPKGLIDDGETPEQAALREVREEAGITCETVEKIDTIEYWYFGNERGARVRYHKFVHFFLMRYVSGDTNDHDHEISEVRWAAPAEAAELLAFDAEKKIVERGFQLLKDADRS